MFFCSLPAKGLDLEIYESLEDVKGEWDDFLPTNHVLRSPVWLSLEKACIPGLRFRFVQIWRRELQIGQAAFLLLNIDIQSISLKELDGSLRKLIQHMLQDKPVSILVCGNLLLHEQPGFFFQDPQDEVEIFGIARKLAVREKRLDRPKLIFLKDLPSSFFQLKNKSLHGFRSYSEDITFGLSGINQWKTEDDYRQSLSQKYAQRARKIREAGSAMQCRKFQSEDILAFGNQMQHLYEEVLNRQVFKPLHLNWQYFFQIMENLPERVDIFGYFLNEKLVGFTSFFKQSEKVVEMHYIGFDTAVNASHKLYFNMLFDGLERAIAEGFEVLWLGRGGEDAKLNLGAKQEENLHFLWVESGTFYFIFMILQSKIRSMAGKVKINRNPFRQIQPGLVKG